MDLIKAYDSVDRAALIAVLRSYGVPNQLVNLVGELYTETKCCARTTEGTSEAFEVKTEGHPETDNFPNAIPARHPRPHFMGQMT